MRHEKKCEKILIVTWIIVTIELGPIGVCLFYYFFGKWFAFLVCFKVWVCLKYYYPKKHLQGRLTDWFDGIIYVKCQIDIKLWTQSFISTLTWKKCSWASAASSSMGASWPREYIAVHNKYTLRIKINQYQLQLHGLEYIWVG